MAEAMGTIHPIDAAVGGATVATQSSAAELFGGMRVVESEIQTGVSADRPADLASDPVRVRWNYRKVIDASAVPETVVLHAASSRGKATVTFSREQLEDSAAVVDRADVCALVRHIVERLTGK